MKRVIFTSTLILAAAIAGLGQNAKSTPDDRVEKGKDRPTEAKKKDGDKKQGPTLNGAASIQAVLQQQLDVRTAQVGDEVILKATKTVKQDGQVVINKGATLVGRITEVQRKAEGAAGSKIALVFDRLQNGDVATPVTASIVSIVDTRSAASVGDTVMSDVSATSRTSGSAGSGSGGGGLLGGVGGVVSGVGSTVNGAANTAVGTVGGVVDTTAQTAGGVTSGAVRTINGLQISSSASGSANGSTTISSRDKNVKLEKGVTFNLLLNSQAGN
ncbi:MAG: hypothetical protein ACK4S4_00245 [Pyrinomonadaceae bacterium]